MNKSKNFMTPEKILQSKIEIELKKIRYRMACLLAHPRKPYVLQEFFQTKRERFIFLKIQIKAFKFFLLHLEKTPASIDFLRIETSSNLELLEKEISKHNMLLEYFPRVWSLLPSKIRRIEITRIKNRIAKEKGMRAAYLFMDRILKNNSQNT